MRSQAIFLYPPSWAWPRRCSCLITQTRIFRHAENQSKRLRLSSCGWVHLEGGQFGLQTDAGRFPSAANELEADVRFWHLADSLRREQNVCFWVESGHLASQNVC